MRLRKMAREIATKHARLSDVSAAAAALERCGEHYMACVVDMLREHPEWTLLEAMEFAYAESSHERWQKRCWREDAVWFADLAENGATEELRALAESWRAEMEARLSNG